MMVCIIAITRLVKLVSHPTLTFDKLRFNLLVIIKYNFFILINYF